MRTIKYATYLKMSESDSTQFVSVLQGQTRPNIKHATQQHIATSIGKAERDQLQRLGGPSICTLSLQSCAASSLIHSFLREEEAARLPTSGFLPRCSYLKLAGEFTWMFWSDGGLAFRLSLSAIPPRYISSIGSTVQPPCRHLRSPAML